ncbi:amidophosphoribosyltransferase [Adhaeribacter aerolatus]|uniref:Amidophosphoribosyltransferase n=1 Tax=Adhaeribacter aerolatus TaxID=670289 RepID=A0A512AXS4_9BACT|nr:ComF family protein [Adhaeribacter aerolatus]GEO04317.1 amidophosphoribosyltransferase [Adhaeribacter aerolatus]
MPAALKNIFSDFLMLLFPEFCQACERTLATGEELVCTHCRLKLPYTNVHLQPPELNPLSVRFFGKVPMQHVLAYLYFNRAGRTQRLLHALKYRGVQEVGELLGSWYGHTLRESGYAQAFELIVPVPLHARKRRQRGYNQSDSFAMGLAAALDLPWSNQVLKRTQYTSSQTHKSRPERWENVAEVFQVISPGLIQNKKILLVDDVITTGATLEACGLTLLKAGCAEVNVCTIAAA